MTKEREGTQKRKKILTTISTTSYKSTTTPSSSTIGTALIPLSEKICTISNTEVCKVAVASGKYLSVIVPNVFVLGVVDLASVEEDEGVGKEE